MNKQPTAKVSRRHFALGATGAVLASAIAPQSPADDGQAPQQENSTYMPANDRLDIIELMAKYAWSYDCSDVVGFANTFTKNGSIDIFGKELAKGHEALRTFIKTGFEMRGDNGWQHLTDHHHFQNFDGNSCIVYSYYLMPESDGDGANVHLRAMGYYVSHCVKNGQLWLFEKREVHRWDGELPWSAQSNTQQQT